jgi:hypothetical protein
MMTTMRFHPVRPARSKTGFGFDTIMSRPDFTRFPEWYARTNRYGPAAAEMNAILSRPAVMDDGLDEAA